ncbi:MAG: Rne/Rng family ribonuclease [Deltaproteobacteria bacterium]|nr:Rne/Rng family ribonuclease [Deltaproteobacteria bacterium]
MKRKMFINAVHREQKRMAIVEGGKLVEFNIQMAAREITVGNIYKGIVQKEEKGLQAAFIDYGASKNGFLPFRDIAAGFFGANGKLTVGQEIVVQVLREQTEIKGALLTTYISLPGRYLVLLPNKPSTGISRKIENEEERKKLAKIMSQIRIQEGMGFIVRTAGMNRKQHELLRDYLNTFRLYKEIERQAQNLAPPALLHQESDFGICSLRDYLTPDVESIFIDDPETFRKVRDYCKIVSPKMASRIKAHKEKSPLFNLYDLEEQIGAIYRERVVLPSGGSIIINTTEAMITIDVNSGKASSQQDVEATAFKNNCQAAEEIARQLRLRDLGGLLAIDFIDMENKENIAEVEKAFRNALSLDKARIQMTKISKFGIMEVSRQKKQPTIQEISYVPCPYCHGRGVRPSLEYTAVGAFHKIQSQAVKGIYSSLVITLPQEVAQYLLNNKRGEIFSLEKDHHMAIRIIGSSDMEWDSLKIETIGMPRHASETENTVPRLPAKKTSSERQGQQPNSGFSTPEHSVAEATDMATPTTATDDFERIYDSIMESGEVRLVELTKIFGK